MESNLTNYIPQSLLYTNSQLEHGLQLEHTNIFLMRQGLSASSMQAASSQEHLLCGTNSHLNVFLTGITLHHQVQGEHVP